MNGEEDRRPRCLTEIPGIDAATSVRPHVIETRGRSGGSNVEAAIAGAESIGVIQIRVDNSREYGSQCARCELAIRIVSVKNVPRC